MDIHMDIHMDIYIYILVPPIVLTIPFGDRDQVSTQALQQRTGTLIIIIIALGCKGKALLINSGESYK